jgi:hypothetical protein
LIFSAFSRSLSTSLAVPLAPVPGPVKRSTKMKDQPVERVLS